GEPRTEHHGKAARRAEPEPPVQLGRDHPGLEFRSAREAVATTGDRPDLQPRAQRGTETRRTRWPAAEREPRVEQREIAALVRQRFRPPLGEIAALELDDER